MKSLSIFLKFSAIFLLTSLISISEGKCETINEIYQTVAYLTGEGEIEHTSIQGINYEIWIKGPSETEPHPFRKPISGTGFFVRKNNQIYLVTAEHVAKKLKHNIKVVVHGPEDRPLIYGISDLTVYKDDPPWFFHKEADVALLKITPQNNFRAAIKVLEPKLLLASESDIGIFTNRVLTTVGFPLSLGLSGKFSPITKSSKAASSLLWHKRIDKDIETTFLILDDPSVQGFSGAPVYALSEVNMGGVGFGVGRFACIGLVHGTLGDNTGGKFAAVVPSYFINEAINEFETIK